MAKGFRGGAIARSSSRSRGAAGSGKSTTALALSERLGGPPALAVVEVDDLRGDLWHVPPALRLHDEERHHLALAHAARIARALLGAGVRRVVVVDTFSASGVDAFRAALRAPVEVRQVALYAEPSDVEARLAARQAPMYRDVATACAMGAELARAGRVVRTSGASVGAVAAEVATMLE